MAILLSSINGNHQRLDGGAMFGNAPRPLWERWAQPDALGRIPLACRGFLVEADGKRLLCEAGIGNFFEPALAERFGVETPEENRVLTSLKELGLGDSDIDYVVLSHLHFDHAGGILPSYEEMRAGHTGLLFPKARFVVGKRAFDRAAEPHLRDRASFVPDLAKKLEATKRLVLVDGERAPGVFEDRLSFFFSEGHTPGQMHAIFRGDSETIFFAGDLVPGAAWVHLPVTMGYDRAAETVIDEKARVYARAEPERWRIFFTHDPAYSSALLVKDAKGKYGVTDSLPDVSRRPI